MEINNNQLKNLISQMNTGSETETQQTKGSTTLKQLTVGTFFNGTISDIINKNVILQLADGNSLNARLADDVNLNIGDKIVVQVKENSDSKLVLKTVATFEGTDATISNALKSANLPESAKNIAIADELIRQQQPLNKETIQRVIYGTQVSPNSDIGDIVTLNKHSVPITAENLSQFENYKELNYSVAKEMNNFEGKLGELLSSTNSDNSKENTLMLTKIFDVITTKISANPETENQNLNINENQQQNTGNVQNNNASIISSDLLDSLKLTFKNADFSNLEQLINTQPENKEAILKELNNIIKSALNTSEAQAANQSEAQNTGNQSNELNKMTDMENNQNMSGNSAVNNSELSKLLKSDDLFKAVKAVIEDRWMLNPEKLNSSETNKSVEIKELYSKILHDTENLEKVFENAGNAGKEIADSLSGIKGNVNFMNSLNDIMSYVQLPIKFSDNNAHGDLYVYNNKKHKYTPGEMITAHLYLELEHLGATDIHVSLQGKSATTKFVLSDDISMQIVEENLPELKRKLEEKGYSCDYSVETINDLAGEEINSGTSPLNEILSKDTSVVKVKRYNFDIRA